MDHTRTKRLYMVKNITSTETNSVGLFRQDTNVNGELYSLIKTDQHDEPTGEVVSLLSSLEFSANLDSVEFGGTNGAEFRREELRFCEEIATAFAQAQSALNISDGNALFDELANTSHRISRGQASLAWLEFNTISNPIITQDMKDFVNAMFFEHFDRIPRDLS